jgi:NADPH:quinone reductase-like Zn-dependent oxidoreductase
VRCWNPRKRPARWDAGRGQTDLAPDCQSDANGMRAITYARYGPPEVLHLADLSTPVPKDDEVLIRVRAAEATKADCEMRSFRFSVRWFWLPLRVALGVRRPRRQILGAYFAGEITRVGKGVTHFKVGDQVFGTSGLRLGAYGEFVAVPARATVVEKPRNMSFTDAAAVPMGGLNALHFMRLARIHRGDHVLILAAGGSIGAHAVQIAKAMGAQVTGVDHGTKAEFLRRLGADHVVDYTREDALAMAGRYDVVFDMVPASSLAAAIRALRPGGRHLNGNPRLSILIRAPFVRVFTSKSATCAFARETRDELLSLKAMIEEGTIAPIVDRVVPMTEAPEAHRLVESEARRGAIVLAIGSDGSAPPAA